MVTVSDFYNAISKKKYVSSIVPSTQRYFFTVLLTHECERDGILSNVTHEGERDNSNRPVYEILHAPQ